MRSHFPPGILAPRPVSLGRDLGSPFSCPRSTKRASSSMAGSMSWIRRHAQSSTLCAPSAFISTVTESHGSAPVTLLDQGTGLASWEVDRRPLARWSPRNASVPCHVHVPRDRPSSNGAAHARWTAFVHRERVALGPPHLTDRWLLLGRGPTPSWLMTEAHPSQPALDVGGWETTPAESVLVVVSQPRAGLGVAARLTQRLCLHRRSPDRAGCRNTPGPTCGRPS